jgi:hypothetical protein
VSDIAVCSMFRDSQTWCGRRIGQVDRFFDQLLRQQGVDAGRLSFFLVEGNSADDTWARLADWRAVLGPDRMTLLKHDVTGSAVASVESQARFRNLSAVGNTALRAARDSGAKYVLWLESDFLIPGDLVARLLGSAGPGFFCVAPVPVFYKDGRKQFYDTWAFEGPNGQRWGNHDLDRLLGVRAQLRPMRSVGSCVLLDGDLMREFSLDCGEGCLPALCRAAGGRHLPIQCDLTLEIEHPCTVNLNGRLV